METGIDGIEKGSGNDLAQRSSQPGFQKAHAGAGRAVVIVLLALLWLGHGRLQAGQLVSTGIIDYVWPDLGSLRIRSDQLGSRPLIFHGMNSANFMTPDGRLARLEDLYPGMAITVLYSREGGRWIISKVLVQDPYETGSPYPPLLISPAPFYYYEPVYPGYRLTWSDLDGDRTTRGPDSAAFDGDITTVPATGHRGAIHRRAP